MLSEELVFKSFLKVERDAPALVVLGSSFHQRGTTNENSLDCRACTDGSAVLSAGSHFTLSYLLFQPRISVHLHK